MSTTKRRSGEPRSVNLRRRDGQLQFSLAYLLLTVTFASAWLACNLWLSSPWGVHPLVPYVNVCVTFALVLACNSKTHRTQAWFVAGLAMVVAFCINLKYWFGLPRFYEVGPSYPIPLKDRILLFYGLKL